MSNDFDHPERDDDVLDALIVQALRGKKVPLPDLTEPEPTLLAEDQEALDALGSDIVERIVAGTWKSRQTCKRKLRQRHGERELAGAMHRGDDETELTDKARLEMEKKIREAEASEESADTDDENPHATNPEDTQP